MQFFFLIFHGNLDFLDFAELTEMRSEFFLVDFRSKTAAENLLHALSSFGFFGFNLLVVQRVRLFRQNLEEERRYGGVK